MLRLYVISSDHTGFTGFITIPPGPTALRAAAARALGIWPLSKARSLKVKKAVFADQALGGPFIYHRAEHDGRSVLFVPEAGVDAAMRRFAREWLDG